MGFINLAALAQKRAREYLQHGAIAVDATVGNGHDTMMLAEAVGTKGEVIGFDIQQTALTATRGRLSRAGVLERVELIEGSHAEMRRQLSQRTINSVDLVMFNLGYLPGGDKHVITETEATLTALKGALSLLSPYGALSIIAYPGHAGGDSECESVAQWCDQLQEEQFLVERMIPATVSKRPPQWYWVQRLGTALCEPS